MAQIYDDSSGTNVELSSEELNILLTSEDIGESLYEVVGIDAFAHRSVDIVNALLQYITKNKNQLARLNKSNGVLLTVPPKGNWSSTVAKPR